MGLYVWVNDPENLSNFIHDAFSKLPKWNWNRTAPTAKFRAIKIFWTRELGAPAIELYKIDHSVIIQVGRL
jgi:hypothetical protein